MGADMNIQDFRSGGFIYDQFITAPNEHPQANVNEDDVHIHRVTMVLKARFMQIERRQIALN